jgi:hypothetical protein
MNLGVFSALVRRSTSVRASLDGQVLLALTLPSLMVNNNFLLNPIQIFIYVKPLRLKFTFSVLIAFNFVLLASSLECENIKKVKYLLGWYLFKFIFHMLGIRICFIYFSNSVFRGYETQNKC